MFLINDSELKRLNHYMFSQITNFVEKSSLMQKKKGKTISDIYVIIFWHRSENQSSNSMFQKSSYERYLQIR